MKLLTLMVAGTTMASSIGELRSQVATGFQFPTTNYQQAITLAFGSPNPDYQNDLHTGEDVLASAHNMPVSAAATGKVMFARPWKSCPNWGYVMVIEHTLADSTKVSSIYGHLDSSTVLVHEGDLVSEGTPVGKTGMFINPATGTPCWREHVHVGVHEGAFGAPVGEYPPWLDGYLAPSEFPDSYLKPSDFILAHLAAQPQVIYSTFGSGDTFGNHGDLVGGGAAVGNAGSEWADPFTVSSPSVVTRYRVAVQRSSGGNTALLSLWSGSSMPTIQLETDLPIGPIGTVSILNAPSVSRPLLVPGVTYWISLRASNPLLDFFGWQWSLPNSTLIRFTRLTGGAWQFGGATVGDAFEIQGTLNQ
jgi:hypothetical protein